MYSKIPVAKLELGMFVADIDRPWMDTPFLIQGFLIEEQEQIVQLRKFCQEVTIDRARSSSAHQPPSTKPAASPAVKLVDTTPRIILERRAAATADAPSHSREYVASRERPSTAQAIASAEDQSHELVITTRDAEFRPTESGRFLLTPKPHAETGNAPSPPPETDSGFARSLMGALSRFIRGDGGKVKPKLATHVGPAPETGRSSGRPSFVPPAVHLIVYEDSKTVEEETAAATNAVARTEEVLHRIAQDIRAGRTLALPEVEEVISDMVDSMVRNPDALMWVMRLRERDEATYGHGLYASVYLLALGRHLGFPKTQLSQLGTIGLLLDIGKIKLPRELLDKAGRLSTDEYETVKTHVQLGIDLLSESGSLDSDIMVGIAQHHERENASGYPRALAGPNISLFGRMAAIADCFAALTNQRPYAEAVSAYDALRSLSGWGGEYFHAPIVEQFIQAVGVFPVGSLVELSTGEVAAVISHNKTRRLKPRVLVITGPDKTRSAHPATMDLLYAPLDANGQAIFIRRGLASGAYGLDARDFYVS